MIRKKLIVFLSIILVSIAFTPKAKALTTISASGESGDVSIESNENIDDNVATAGNNVYIRGVIEDDLFVAGANINIEGEIKGNLFAAGNMITINGKVDQDAFVAGNTISFGENSSVERDLYTAGNLINVEGKVGRNLMVGSARLDLNGTVDGNVNAETSSMNIGDKANITGTLTYTSDNQIDEKEESNISGEVTYKEPTQNTNKTSSFQAKATSWIYSLLSFLFVGIILVLLMPKWFDKVSEITTKQTLKSMGIGFLILIVTPVAAIIAIITLIGFPITLILTLLYILILYIAKYWVAYCVGKFIGKGKYSPIVTMIIGIVILQIIFIIPIIGGLASFLTMLAGTGALWLAKPFQSAK